MISLFSSFFHFWRCIKDFYCWVYFQDYTIFFMFVFFLLLDFIRFLCFSLSFCLLSLFLYSLLLSVFSLVFPCTFSIFSCIFHSYSVSIRLLCLYLSLLLLSLLPPSLFLSPGFRLQFFSILLCLIPHLCHHHISPFVSFCLGVYFFTSSLVLFSGFRAQFPFCCVKLFFSF